MSVIEYYLAVWEEEREVPADDESEDEDEELDESDSNVDDET